MKQLIHAWLLGFLEFDELYISIMETVAEIDAYMAGRNFAKKVFFWRTNR